MIAAVFLVLLRPLSVQCALLLLLLLLGTVATIVFFCSWQRYVARGKQPIRSALSGRSKCRGECWNIVHVLMSHVVMAAPYNKNWFESVEHPLRRSCAQRCCQKWPFHMWPVYLPLYAASWIYCKANLCVLCSVVGLRTHHFRSEVGWTFVIISLVRHSRHSHQQHHRSL